MVKHSLKNAIEHVSELFPFDITVLEDQPINVALPSWLAPRRSVCTSFYYPLTLPRPCQDRIFMASQVICSWKYEDKTVFLRHKPLLLERDSNPDASTLVYDSLLQKSNLLEVNPHPPTHPPYPLHLTILNPHLRECTSSNLAIPSLQLHGLLDICSHQLPCKTLQGG